MRDYAEAYTSFSIETLANEVLAGSLRTGLNACVAWRDRWASEGRVALHWMGSDGTRATVTFAELRADPARFANLPANLLHRLADTPRERLATKTHR
jgi:acetyl-CoA synthetase